MGTLVQREIRSTGDMERRRLGDMPRQARLDEIVELDAWDR
jgi:hypothetical protein